MRNDRMIYTHVESPIGNLLLRSDGEALTGLWMGPSDKERDPSWQRDDPWFAQVQIQLAAYFAGDRQDFDLPLVLRGTEFQERVWHALGTIPFGETISYGELADRIGAPKAVRAVGAAVGRNPISIIVPCHRVVGSDGRLTGYGGGLERKRWLLDHEASHVAHADAAIPGRLFQV